MDANVCNALTLLAAKLEKEKRPLEALHCLRALLMSKLLPDQEARVRVAAGRLQLEHTSACLRQLTLSLSLYHSCARITGRYLCAWT